MHEKVKTYLENLPSPQKEVTTALRTIIFEVYPEIEENFKNGVPWYEGKYYLVGLKDHVNIGFSINGLDAKQLKELEGKGKYMRHIKVKNLENIDKDKIVHLLHMCTLVCEDPHSK
jgi:hypothetical protein